MIRKNKKKDERGPSVSYHALAFVDLLGQQELLRNLRHVPKKDDEEAMKDLAATIESTYKTVREFRSNFNEFVSRMESNNSSPPDIRGELRREARLLRGNKIKVNQFSDFTVAFTAMRPTKLAKTPISSIYTLFGAMSESILLCLANGHPVRGGIDIGWGIHISDNEVYGGALAKAYALESHVAQYPRIVVGDMLIDFIQQEASLNTGQDLASVHSKSMAKICMSMIARDDDGFPFIDFMGEAVRKIFRDPERDFDTGREFTERAYLKVIELSQKFKEEKNSKVAFKYSLLRQYMESRLHLWNIENRTVD